MDKYSFTDVFDNRQPYKQPGLNFLDKAIVFVVVANVIFTAVMIYLFMLFGSVPDTLIVAWFAFTTGEVAAGAIIQRKKYDIEYQEKLPHKPPSYLPQTAEEEYMSEHHRGY